MILRKRDHTVFFATFTDLDEGSGEEAARMARGSVSACLHTITPRRAEYSGWKVNAARREF